VGSSTPLLPSRATSGERRLRRSPSGPPARRPRAPAAAAGSSMLPLLERP
jgi:hypothetical protein